MLQGDPALSTPRTGGPLRLRSMLNPKSPGNSRAGMRSGTAVRRCLTEASAVKGDHRMTVSAGQPRCGGPGWTLVERRSLGCRSVPPWNSATRSAGQAASHGIRPAATCSRMASVCCRTEATSPRSNAQRMAARSRSVNSGRMSRAKLGTVSAAAGGSTALAGTPASGSDQRHQVAPATPRRPPAAVGPQPTPLARPPSGRRTPRPAPVAVRRG
jgi:hypothetical protein